MISLKDIRYTIRRGFSVAYEELASEDQFLVLNDIINASGRGNMIVNNLSKASGAAGIMVLVMIAGVIVWDIFSSEYVLETTVRDAMVTAAFLGGLLIDDLVEARCHF
ncbi:uncharacterized protein LOC111025189 isoform X3 [Momordica charantia]|uniref:Uncharacterized protein LOC111025189 isoform X3 n=1 Tax=Momordica charantia TaxID=3673 RepID=A0A6J1DWM6_MOMCH|nr:uncharacterized protein LOC111025189 isoform X3 [Momordica charantia]